MENNCKASLSMMHHHMYLKLMADLHPEMVYKYLLTHNTYRADDCLKLCQAWEIVDASAYLLEWMGNVSSILQLLLQTLEKSINGTEKSSEKNNSDSEKGINMLETSCSSAKGR